MRNIFIRYPIWHTKSVGVREDEITDDLAIEIIYLDVTGKRIYPHTYIIEKEKALSYPIQIVKNNARLHIIPIEDLHIENDDERAKREYMQICGF